MTLGRMRLLSLIVLLAMSAFALWAWSRMGAQARLPVHWDVSGRVDRTAPALVALFMPVAVAGFVSLLMSVLPAIEPLQRRMERSMTPFRIVWIGMLAIMILVQSRIALPAFGIDSSGIWPIAAMGLFFVLLGNALPKSRPSFFVGIRTPWTLSDPENWIATHRFGGRMMMVGGIMLMLVPILPEAVRIAWAFAAIAIVVLPPLVFSYVYWRRHRGEVDG